MKIYRIYVERKPGFDIKANNLKNELTELLQIKGIDNIRIFNRYDVSGIDEDTMRTCRDTVFSEPQTDVIYEKLSDADKIFAVEFLPGQYDQRADSCCQCIQFVTMSDKPIVKTATVYCLYGNISDENLHKIKGYLINEVESREADLKEKESLEQNYEVNSEIEYIKDLPSIKGSKEEFNNFISKYGLAMDVDDLKALIEYFNSEDKIPTITEIRVIDTYWSDHCRHTTFSTVLKNVEIDDEDIKNSFNNYLSLKKKLGSKKAVNLMDIATIAAKYLKNKGLLKNLDDSDEINACTVKTRVNVNGKAEEWLFLFKNETHNHPTEIEPFGGAATCIGGAIRDPLSGRGYVYQAMRLTGAADPRTPINDTIKGKLPQRKIVQSAADGYSSYGNQIGLPTGLVREIYHDGYKAKRLEVGAVVGAVPAKNVRREKPVPGDIVLLIGGKTGRDGCGGATGSSKSHNIESIETCGAEVQKGNPIEERKLQRLFRNPEIQSMIKKCNDFGAGGVSVAIGELADSLDIYLDRVLKKYEGLNATELAISESQERMAVVIEKKNLEHFIELANSENIDATHVADVTDNGRMSMYFHGRKVVDISREFLNSNGAVKFADAHIVKCSETDNYIIKNTGDFKSAYQELLSNLNICSQRGLSEMFDSTIVAGNMLFPFGGRYCKTPIDAMISKFPVLNGDTTTCSVMAYGTNPYISSQNGYKGAYLAVIESISKVVAAGGDLEQTYLSFQEYFERLRDESKRWGKPLSALLGALDAQIDLEIAAIGGKDSMSGSFENLDVPPTFISFATSITEEKEVISNEFKKLGNEVLCIFPDRNGLMPKRDNIRKYFDFVSGAITSDCLSATSIGIGGIAESIFKNCLGNAFGFEFDKELNKNEIFSYNYGAFLVEVEPSKVASLCKNVPEFVNIKRIGKIINNYELKIQLAGNEQVLSIAELETVYGKPLESVFPSRCKEDDKQNVAEISYKAENKGKFTVNVNSHKPKVLLPVFPGTNCEYDTAYAFEKAGAEPEIVIIRNRNTEDVKNSLNEIRDKLAKSDILMLSGGFSGGDEPDGSGKFITSFFRNDILAEEIDNLLNKRQGLIGGICNGFQALIKLGLLPFGKIVKADVNSPTLTFNKIGRHQSRIVRTHISSNMSPWLRSAEVGDINAVAISHGEGRFICNDDIFSILVKNGQIATQYVDFNNQPSMDIDFNPNGSYMAVEAITSPDGRVFGKMGHTERMREGLYKNVPMSDCKRSNLFEDAVRYFKG